MIFVIKKTQNLEPVRLVHFLFTVSLSFISHRSRSKNAMSYPLFSNFQENVNSRLGKLETQSTLKTETVQKQCNHLRKQIPKLQERTNVNLQCCKLQSDHTGRLCLSDMMKGC